MVLMVMHNDLPLWPDQRRHHRHPPAPATLCPAGERERERERERENNALCYRVRQLEQSLDRVTTILPQSERERVDTREELLHVKYLHRLTTSQNRLKDRL
jgi:hypothetical protein